MADVYVVHRDDRWSLDAGCAARHGPRAGPDRRLDLATRQGGLPRLDALALQGLMLAESPFGVAKTSGPSFAFEQITDLIVVVSVGCR
jgi:hypothetical protein